MYPNLSYNNISKTYVSVMEKKRPYMATRKREILTVTGKPGGYLSKTEIEVLVIPVKFLVEGNTAFGLRETAEDFAAWLKVDAPAPLVFTDEPNRTYFGVVEGEVNPEEFVTYSEVWVNFLCPDPYKYGPERSEVFTGDLTQIENNGSEDAYPVFTAEVQSDITNLDIVSLEGYMRIGSPAPVDQTPTQGKVRIVNDEMNTLTGWTQQNAIDNGTVSGEMKIDGNGFLANLWGEVVTPPRWQGPSLARALPSPVQDFEAEIAVTMLNGITEVGMIEIYFRNAAGEIVAKLGIEDSWRESKLNRVKFQLGEIGERIDFNRIADNPRHWDDFDGVLRITRRGREFTAYYAKVTSTGVHHTRAFINYYDSFDAYQDPVASVQVAVRKWGDSAVPAAFMRINRLQVWQVNSTTVNEPVYVAKAGDIIVIDHKNSEITINGEDRIWLKDFGSSFFPLKPGVNPLSFSPSYAVGLTVEWRDRY